MAESTITGWCQRGECGRCAGVVGTGTRWNWWCTHRCHPEPIIRDPSHQPALDFWRSHRKQP